MYVFLTFACYVSVSESVCMVEIDSLIRVELYDHTHISLAATQNMT